MSDYNLYIFFFITDIRVWGLAELDLQLLLMSSSPCGLQNFISLSVPEQETFDIQIGVREL
jgi:hypothetical protein